MAGALASSLQAPSLSSSSSWARLRQARPFAAGAQPWRRPAVVVQAAASKGFASSGKGGAAKKQQQQQGGDKKRQPKLERYLDLEGQAAEAAAEAAAQGWIRVASLADLVSKPLKPVILANGQALCLYKVGDRVFCSDAYSTAFKFPLHDGTLLSTKAGPAVEVPLDGTTYALETGRVLSWCPKNNPVRAVLGALKDKSEPVDLKVFPAEVRGQDVYVRLAAAA